MNLSRNFTLEELTRSRLADELGLDNRPGPREIEALRFLCERVQQPWRDEVGPLRVTSGFRVPELDRAVGGSGSGQHVRGEAGDLLPLECPRDYAFGVLLTLSRRCALPVDQAITYGSLQPHVHVSFTVRRRPRRSFLEATGDAGDPYRRWAPWA